MLLDSNQSFDTLAEYDPATGVFTTFSRKNEPERVKPISGHFDHLGGKRFLLFRLDGILYMEVDRQRIPMANHTVETHSVNGNRVLRVLANDNVVLELTYTLPQLDPPLWEDPTPFVEAEDYDFGLFLSNISQDSGRQARIYSEN